MRVVRAEFAVGNEIAKREMSGRRKVRDRYARTRLRGVQSLETANWLITAPSLFSNVAPAAVSKLSVRLNFSGEGEPNFKSIDI